MVKNIIRKIVFAIDYAIYRITKYFYDRDEHFGRIKIENARTGGMTLGILIGVNLGTIILPFKYNNPESTQFLFTPFFCGISLIYVILGGFVVLGYIYGSEAKYEEYKRKYANDPKEKIRGRILLAYIILSFAVCFAVGFSHPFPK